MDNITSVRYKAAQKITKELIWLGGKLINYLKLFCQLLHGGTSMKKTQAPTHTHISHCSKKKGLKTKRCLIDGRQNAVWPLVLEDDIPQNHENRTNKPVNVMKNDH